MKQKILDLKDELESHRASKSKDHIKGQRRVNPRRYVFRAIRRLRNIWDVI